MQNPKQAQNPNVPILKRFDFLNFVRLNLFGISCFGFRTSQPEVGQ
jgi:hypothetical protein